MEIENYGDVKYVNNVNNRHSQLPKIPTDLNLLVWNARSLRVNF